MKHTRPLECGSPSLVCFVCAVNPKRNLEKRRISSMESRFYIYAFMLLCVLEGMNIRVDIWVDECSHAAYFECIKIHTNQLLLEMECATDDLCVSLLDPLCWYTLLSLLPSPCCDGLELIQDWADSLSLHHAAAGGLHHRDRYIE